MSVFETSDGSLPRHLPTINTYESFIYLLFNSSSVLHLTHSHAAIAQMTEP
jgi:hypothetical protein